MLGARCIIVSGLGWRPNNLDRVSEPENNSTQGARVLSAAVGDGNEKIIDELGPHQPKQSCALDQVTRDFCIDRCARRAVWTAVALLQGECLSTTRLAPGGGIDVSATCSSLRATEYVACSLVNCNQTKHDSGV